MGNLMKVKSALGFLEWEKLQYAEHIPKLIV